MVHSHEKNVAIAFFLLVGRDFLRGPKTSDQINTENKDRKQKNVRKVDHYLKLAYERSRNKNVYEVRVETRLQWK